MAGDMVKARIVIDATGAIKEVEKLSSEMQGAIKPSTQYAKEVAKIGKELRDAERAAFSSSASFEEQIKASAKIVSLNQDYSVATGNLTNSLKLEGELLKIQGASLKDVAASIKKVKDAQSTLYNAGEIKEAQRLNDVLNERQKVYSDLEREQKRLNNANKDSGIVQYGKKVAELLKNIMGFQLIIATVRKGLTAISNTIRDSIKYAAELEQITNKLTTVFDGFSNSATKAAQSLSSQLGVAMSTASSTLSTIGDLLQAQGMGTAESLETATRWAKQFQDIIAFKDINMDLNEFAQNFMSGAAGNLRNFRTFGSIVKESAVNAELAKKGLDKLTGSQLELAKMTTRAEMALRQQANSIGATEREWETTLSITRRLKEEQKQLRENLGDMLNKPLNMIRQRWADILDQINKSIIAQKQFGQGAIDIQEYDIKNKKADQDALLQALKTSGLTKYQLQNASQYYSNPETRYQQKINQELEELNDIIVKFGGSVDDVASVLSLDLTNGAYQWLKAQEKERKAIINNAKELEKLTANIETQSESYSSFMESINSIAGVNGVGSNFLSSDSLRQSNLSLSTIQKLIQHQSIEDARQASYQIMHATADTMGKALESSVGEFGHGELLELQKEGIRKLYEILWNNAHQEASPGGTNLTKEENTELQDLIQNYEDLNTQIKDLDLKEEARASLASLFEGYQKENKRQDMISGMMSRGMTKQEATVRADWISEIDKVDSLFKELGETTLTINGNLVTESDVLEELRKRQEKQLEVTEETTELIKNGDWYSAFTGEFTGIIDAIKGSGDWVTAIISIAASMESFEDLFGYADRLLSQLDAFLKPLKPMIQTIIALLDMVVVPVLKALFPLIKLVASVITIIQGAVNAIYAWLTGSWGDKNDEAARAWDEAMSKNREIWAMQLELKDINQNTEDMSDEFAYYSKLLEKGVINTSEFDSLTNGFTMQRAGTTSIGSYVTGTNGITYNTGDTVINISGAEMTREELIEVVSQAFARRQQAGYV